MLILNPSPNVRRVLLTLAVVLLFALAWLGLSGGMANLADSHSLGQKAQTVTQFGYGLLAALGAVTTFWGRRWNRLVLRTWAVTITLAGGLASVVWGATSLLIGALSGAASLLCALGIIWMLRVGARGLTSA